jgi:hypothetical protein
LGQFEYVTTLVSFVVAFGVARLLAGWARQYALRAQTRIYPLQVAASALLLIALLQSTWAFWIYRDITWTFLTFLGMLLTQLALVGASALIHPPDGHFSSIRDYYFDVRHAVFGLTAAWLALGGVLAFFLRPSITVVASFEDVVAIRAASLCIFAVLAWSDRPAYHWVGFAALAALQIWFIVSFTYDPTAA